MVAVGKESFEDAFKAVSLSERHRERQKVEGRLIGTSFVGLGILIFDPSSPFRGFKQTIMELLVLPLRRTVVNSTRLFPCPC